MNNHYITIDQRKIGTGFKPLIIAEIGINHEGNFKKAIEMVYDAYEAGCECVKFQSHVVEDEMIPVADKVVPANADESIYQIIKRCSLSEEQELRLKEFVEKLG